MNSESTEVPSPSNKTVNTVKSCSNVEDHIIQFSPVPARADLSSLQWTQQQLELFTDLYLQHEVLLQPATRSDKNEARDRSAALRALGAALEPGLEPVAYRTRSLIYMYRCLCRNELRTKIALVRRAGLEVTVENVMLHAPDWLRRAEDKLHMLPLLIAEGYTKPCLVIKPPHASRGSCLLALANLVRASRGVLPSTARIDRLKATWDKLRHMSRDKLSRLRRRACGSLWLHEWLAIDVELLYDNSYSLITEETFQATEQVRDLERLLESAQLLRGGWWGGWLDVRRAYYQECGYVSLVTLQRLWFELRTQTRRELCWRVVTPKEPRNAAALQLYEKVVSMFPSVLTEPATTWRDLVDQGRVHVDQYEVGEEKRVNLKECEEVLEELMAQDKDDDIILIEREIETVELHESSDEESPMGNDKDKAPRESEMEALRREDSALTNRLVDLEQQMLDIATQSRGDYQNQVEIHQSPARSITSRNASVETDEQTQIEADDDGDSSVEKSSLLTEQSSIALLQKLDPNSCKTVLILEDDDDDSSDMTNQNQDLIENVAELNIKQPIDSNITKDNTDIIERALKVRDALESVTPTKTDISNTSTNRNSDSDYQVPDDSVSKYFKTNYNDTKPTATPANDSVVYNINETISLDSQTTPAIPDDVSIDNIVTTSDSQTEIISPKSSDNDTQITKRIKSNVIPADIAREIQKKKDIEDKILPYKRSLSKQDIAIDNQMKKHITSLDNETIISVLQARIANEKAMGIITNDDQTEPVIPDNDHYNIVISDVKSLNQDKTSDRSLLKPNIANIMTNEPHNSNHIIEHSYSQNAECDPDDLRQENNLTTNNKDHQIDNDCDSNDSCELVIEESDSRLKQTDSSIQQCGSQIKQDGSRAEQTDSPIEQGSSQIGQVGSQREPPDSQIYVKPTATLIEQTTADVSKYFKSKLSNKRSLVASKTIVSFDNIIPWIRPSNRVIKCEQSDSCDKQTSSSVRQSGSGVAMCGDSAGDSDDTACSEHSFGSNNSEVEFDIDPKLLQTVSVPLVRCDYLLSRSHIPNPTSLQFNLNDRHEVNDPKETPKNPLTKVNDLKKTSYDTDTSDFEADDLIIDSDYEPSDKIVLYSSDVTRVKGKRHERLYNTSEKETATETTDKNFDVAWRNLSADFILNRKNIELLALCRPLSVVLERLSGSVGGVRGREWGEGGQGRRQKRVRLSDIEEVRRVNRSLLTAQVAPIAAGPAGGAEATTLLKLKQFLEKAQRQPHFSDQLHKLQKQQQDVLTWEQQQRQRLQRQQQQVREVPPPQRQPRVKESPKYCCAARRHRAINDARLRMYRGNNLASPRELPLHEFSHKNRGKCTCCCTHLLVPVQQNKPKVKPGPKSKKPRQPTEKEKKRKKTKPTSKSKSKSKTKLKHQKKILPTTEEIDEKLKDDLQEWNRQKTINQKYFYISSMMTDKNKTTPKDNVAPKDNATPIDNTTPNENATPIDNATPENNTTPIESITPKDNATERAGNQPQVTTAPVSHLFHTESFPIHKKYFNQTTIKLCMNVTNGQTDKPVPLEAPATSAPTLGNTSNDQDIEKPVANATVKPPPPLLPLRVRSDLCAPNQSTTFMNLPATCVNQPSAFKNQPATCVNQPSTFKNQTAEFKNQTASFVNQPATFKNQPKSYVYQPSTFVKQPVTFINQPVTFLHQHVTPINQPKKTGIQPKPMNRFVAPVHQLHPTLIPVSFKMIPPKANIQKFVKIAPKPPPPPPYEKFESKTCKIEPTDAPSEKQIYNTKENVKLTANELNQPDGSLFQHLTLSKDTLEHRDSTKTTKDMPVTEQTLMQRALDDVVSSMETETESKMPDIKTLTSQRRRASCDFMDAVAPKRRASDVINYFGSEMTIRPIDTPEPSKFTLEPNKITIKALPVTVKPHDVTVRCLEVAGSQENAKGSRDHEVKIKLESSELTKKETSDIEPVLKENSSVTSVLKKALLNSISSKDTGKVDDVSHQVEGKDRDSKIPNVITKEEKDKSAASIEDSVRQNEDTMGNIENNKGLSNESIKQSGDAVRPSDAVESNKVNIKPIEDTTESNEYALWSNDYTEPTDDMDPNHDAMETSEINMGTHEVNVGPSEYTLVSNEHGSWSSDDPMGHSEDSMGSNGGNTGQSEVIMKTSDGTIAHSKHTKVPSNAKTEVSIDITEDSSNDVAVVSSDDVTCTSGATNATKASNVTKQIRVVLKKNSVPSTMTVVSSQPYTMTLNASDVSKRTSGFTVGSKSLTSLMTKQRVHLDGKSDGTSASNVVASKVVETASDVTRSSDRSDVEEISETGPPPQLPPLSYRVGDLRMLPPVRARDLVEGRDPTKLSIHRVDLSRDLLLLQQSYLLVTEHDIPCRDPTYFHIGPDSEARMIIFEDDVQPPPPSPPPPPPSKEKAKIQVKDFARVEAGNAYNGISVGGAAVPAETTSPADILLAGPGAAPDRLTTGSRCAGNLFQKITDDPLVYAQVYTVVQSLRRARQLLLQQAPLGVLHTASGDTHPLLRDVSMRPVGLRCAVPGALHDLVDRLNTQSNEAIAQRSMNSITIHDSDED